MVRAISAVAFAVVAMNVASAIAMSSNYDAELTERSYMSEIEARQYLADLANVDVRELEHLDARDIQDALVYIREDKSSLATTTTHSTYIPKATPCFGEDEVKRRKLEKEQKDKAKKDKEDQKKKRREEKKEGEKKKKEEKAAEKANHKHRCSIFHPHCNNKKQSTTTTSTHSTSTPTSSSSPTARPGASSVASATSTSTSSSPTFNSGRTDYYNGGYHHRDQYADNGFGELPYDHPSAYDASRRFDSDGYNNRQYENNMYGARQGSYEERPYGEYDAYPGAYPHYNNAYASPSPTHPSASSSSTAASAHITPAPTSTHSDLKVSTVSTTRKGTVHVTYITTAAQPQCTKATFLEKLRHHDGEHRHHRRELEEETLFARQ